MLSEGESVRRTIMARHRLTMTIRTGIMLATSAFSAEKNM